MPYCHFENIYRPTSQFDYMVTQMGGGKPLIVKSFEEARAMKGRTIPEAICRLCKKKKRSLKNLKG